MKTFNCKCHWCDKDLIRKTQSVHVEFHFCDRTCKGEYQRTQKPVTREWLYEHYVVKGLDTTQIAHMVKRDPKSVWSWLKDFGIPTRPRGTASKTKFAKGHKQGVGRKLSEESRQKIADKCKERGSVPYMKNGQHWLKTAPKSDHPRWRGGITPERQKFYATIEWQSVARKVWKRDKRTCQRCGKEHDAGTPFDIHHIVSFQYEPLRCELSNLVLLCEVCHYWVHGPENSEGSFLKPCP